MANGDGSIRGALRTPERSVDPDPAFGDALFERLVEELGRPRRRPAPRSLRRIGGDGPKRALVAAAVVVGAFAVLAAAIWPLRSWFAGPQPGTDVTPSTPFRATIVGSFPASAGGAETPGDFKIRVSYRGPDLWRIDVLGGSAPWQPLINENVHGAGSYVLWDGENLIAYDAENDAFVRQGEHATSFSPLNLLGFTNEAAGWEQACASGERVGDGTFAGRPVDVFRCPAPEAFSSTGAQVELWVDADSRLILQLVSGDDLGQEFPPGPIAWYPGERIEVTDVLYDPAFESGTFAMPPDARTRPVTPRERKVVSFAVGDEAPPFHGTALDGSRFDLSDTRGTPTLVYVWAEWCEPCTDLPLNVLDRVAATRDDLTVVTVGEAVDPAAFEAFVRDHGLGFPVVLPDEQLSDAWGIKGIPVLVLLDAEGHLVGAYSGWSGELADEADLESVVDAFVSGAPLPDIPGTSSQTAPG
jgi:thiol-disulfide isomerase/thioredoxin